MPSGGILLEIWRCRSNCRHHNRDHVYRGHTVTYTHQYYTTLTQSIYHTTLKLPTGKYFCERYEKVDNWLLDVKYSHNTTTCITNFHGTTIFIHLPMLLKYILWMDKVFLKNLNSLKSTSINKYICSLNGCVNLLNQVFNINRLPVLGMFTLIEPSCLRIH